jgi:hypothetical protein
MVREKIFNPNNFHPAANYFPSLANVYHTSAKMAANWK